MIEMQRRRESRGEKETKRHKQKKLWLENEVGAGEAEL